MGEVTVKWTTVLIDLLTLSTVGCVMVLIEKTTTPFRRGFFCSDETIRYPRVTHTKFNSKSLAATCLLISFTTDKRNDELLVWVEFVLMMPQTGGVILLVFLVAVTPSRRGFFCEDETIRYEFKDSTIPNWLLYIYSFTIPFLVITFTEYRLQRNKGPGTFLTRPVPLWFISIYRSLIDFLFGCAASQLVTDIGKYSIGRLRPNFLDVCKPNVDLSNCSVHGHLYIEKYTCTGSPDDAKESRVSFPSGHSSFSAFTMLYVVIFIQVRWRVNTSALRLAKSGVQLSLMLLAYYTALSRVMDNKHHWSDVSVGALVGAVSASLTARYVSGLVGTRKEEQNGNSESLGLTPAVRYRQTDGSHQNDVEAGRGPKEQSVVVPPPSYDMRVS